ncbi:potassium transporter Kup [Telmatospirillum sp.]|uniref:potassium transporter Kup n=1 Tax=Telmatospirillum sp. TaxID=2079197 RepID=UPI0028482984|nr:potassium transporter Kup [Telmatospirillum sp.]MDR3438399.1 potassium transporter Kup [Telmatospirillum sp.]
MTEQMTKAEGCEKSSFGALLIGALGIVYGDIGTSPLYTLHECFAGAYPLEVDRANILGILSLIFWSINLIVSVKYVIVTMRANNRGEGGSLALLAMLHQAAERHPWLPPIVSTLGIAAASLFYGDSTITPAVSVLSAIEGLQVAAPALEDYILPITIAILVVLFAIQRKGTAMVGSMFGPVMIVWFIVLAVLGLKNIAKAPLVLAAISPHYAALFLYNHGLTGFLSLGAVVLAVTGGEALYADMGHFGRTPIAIAWYFLVLPALVLNYFGQGALLLSDAKALENPFFLLAPSWALVPLVILAGLATVIASQAVISGAFSITAQAMQLGYLPRMRILHTSAKEKGQIYIPFLNSLLAVFVIALVLGFRTSTNLAGAYGIAVTGTMGITTVMVGMVAAYIWGWKSRMAYGLLGLFLIVDLSFFAANTTKIVNGGWFPLAMGVIIFILLMTWKRGRSLVFARREDGTMPIEDFVTSVVGSPNISRPKGTAIFLTSSVRDFIPPALMHNLKHNQVLHQITVLLTIIVEDIPHVAPAERITSAHVSDGIFRVMVRFGFMDETNVPRALANASEHQLGFFYEPMRLSYFLSRETIITGDHPGMDPVRHALFAWMSRSASSAMEFFALPVNRVVELGDQIEI